MGVRCFLLEELPRVRRRLRRYSHGAGCPGSHGYHNNLAPFDETDYPLGPVMVNAYEGGPEKDDIRWPLYCPCGYRFTDEDPFQVFTERLYGLPDGRECVLRDAPVGAMWNAWWYKDVPAWVGSDGLSLVVMTPGGDWHVDGPSKSGGKWTRTGTVPNITAVPSIHIQARDGTTRYHGFLRNGELIPC